MFKTKQLTPNGSAWSHENGPTLGDGRDSGTATRIKQTSKAAIEVASMTTTALPYTWLKYAPIAGLVTKLAANVADTYKWKKHF